jgi:hypothetical protein
MKITFVLPVFFLMWLTVPAFAQAENIQITADGKPVQVDVSNPIVQVRPNSFVYGTLDTSENPIVTCQLQDCLYQVEQTGYGFHVRFSGLMGNYTNNIKIGEWLAVFVPVQETKPTAQDTGFSISGVPNFVLVGVGLGVIAIVGGVAIKKSRRRPLF